MGIDHSNPYIHSTTILCDTIRSTEFSHEHIGAIATTKTVYKPLAMLTCIINPA